MPFCIFASLINQSQLLKERINFQRRYFGAYFFFKSVDLGPVVQSIVSLMSSLRGQLVKCFTTL